MSRLDLHKFLLIHVTQTLNCEKRWQNALGLDHFVDGERGSEKAVAPGYDAIQPMALSHPFMILSNE